MPQQKIDLLKLPKSIRDPVNDLVRALNAASTRADVEREGAMQISFILGLETAKRLRPADIEALYMIFDDAVQERLAQLPA
ncbi:hypothetical protein ACI2KS_10925 [Pseudomonas sp. NPDC087358]|uniref:hypothetical protein n=1 Tax=Pseudomonas sp. NPDC087358 TaxID=3364439 RepID=UPI00384A5D41